MKRLRKKIDVDIQQDENVLRQEYIDANYDQDRLEVIKDWDEIPFVDEDDDVLKKLED